MTSISQSIFAATYSPVPNVNATPNSVSNNDIVAASMFAALETDGDNKFNPPNCLKLIKKYPSY